MGLWMIGLMMSDVREISSNPLPTEPKIVWGRSIVLPDIVHNYYHEEEVVVEIEEYEVKPIYVGQLSREEMLGVMDIVEWPIETREEALRVAWCESRWRVDAVGSEGEMGLFQIHPYWHSDATFDAVGNVRAAMRISNGGSNWWAWVCKP